MQTLLETAYELKDTKKLIRTFTIQNGNKSRIVNDPIPELKNALRAFNFDLTNYYVDLLKKYEINEIPQAYLPHKSIKTNADIHKHSKEIIKFDFSHFYDDVKFEYFNQHLEKIINPKNLKYNESLIKRLIIDPKTNGVTQGLPVSGALAGIALIPFWIELKKRVPDYIKFTQYSDDLIFSYSNQKAPKQFTVKILTRIIKETLHDTHRDFTLNDKKTCKQRNQYRKVTGVRVNHNNQTTPNLKDYRWFRSFTHKLKQGSTLDELLTYYGFESKASFVGKVSYMRSIDETNKVNKLIQRNASLFIKNNLFKTWLIVENPFV